MANAGPKTELTFFHGTTLRRAQQITNDQAFDFAHRLYVVVPAHRDLAEFFARRKAGREGDRPAVVSVLLEDKDFQGIWKRGEARLRPFDAEDNPRLQGRNQWEIDPIGVRILNVRLIEINYEAIT